MRKKHKPLYYVLWMIAQPFVLSLSVLPGAWLDSLLYRNFYDRPHPVGHPVPFFSLLVPILAFFVTLTVFIVMLVGLIRCLRRQKREQEGIMPPPSEWDFCPACGAKLFSRKVCLHCGKKLGEM